MQSPQSPQVGTLQGLFAEVKGIKLYQAVLANKLIGS
jgi:hypothetical protein